MPDTVQSVTLYALVKEATQPHHTAVEKLLHDRLAAIATGKAYGSLLKMFYGYYSPIENNILQQLTVMHLPDITERRRASAILHDLATIGQDTALPEACRKLPLIANASQAFGALYVLEGSTLGGKLIARMFLQKSIPAITENALTFFNGYREKTGAKWKFFLDVFNQQENAEEIIATANDTFKHLKSWIERFPFND